MGSWGITERESDYGLDLLSTIVDTQLKAVNFSTFNVADAIDTITADIKLMPLTFQVEWCDGHYPSTLLGEPMVLTTPHLRATSKVPFTATGNVTGWIDPNKLERNQETLAAMILDNSPNTKTYLTGTLGLSPKEATQVMLQYMGTDEGKAATMERVTPVLDATEAKAYDPCVVTFKNGEETVSTQYIKYQNYAEQPSVPMYSGGMDFSGWYTEGTNNPFDTKSTPVTDDMVLVAQWADHIHQFGSWTVTEPTCTEPGTQTHTCTVTGCGYTATEQTSDPLGHDWREAWEQNEDGHWHICDRCGATSDVETHTYSEWTVTTPATTTAPGEETRVCTACQRPETRPIAQLPVPPVTPITPVTPVTPSIPDTPTPLDPGTSIPDEEVPLANTVGLNNIDHFAYIAGYEDGTVRPTNNITRAEVATIFFRLMTEEYRVANWSTSNTFTDAGANAWYNAAISTAAKAGILKGYADGSVKPNANITRAEFAAIAARFISDDVTDDGVGDFSDTANHWAAKEIRLAAKAGWVQGDGNRFRPDDPITRAEVMVLVNRMLDRVPNADHMLPGMKTWSDNPAGTWYYAAVQEATNDHAYERAEDGATEIWTELTEAKDWTALEAEWAANNGASAPKEEAPSENEAA